MTEQAQQLHSRWDVTVHSPVQTERLAALLGGIVEPGAVIVLDGDLGAGKTTFVRGLARGMGLSEAIVSSPTFTLIHEYDGDVPLYHFDTYRLDDPQQFVELGADEYLYGEGVCAIEWGGNVRSELPPERLEIVFTATRLAGRDESIATVASSAHDDSNAAAVAPSGVPDVSGATVTAGGSARGSARGSAPGSARGSPLEHRGGAPLTYGCGGAEHWNMTEADIEPSTRHIAWQALGGRPARWLEALKRAWDGDEGAAGSVLAEAGSGPRPEREAAFERDAALEPELRRWPDRDPKTAPVEAGSASTAERESQRPPKPPLGTEPTMDPGQGPKQGDRSDA